MKPHSVRKNSRSILYVLMMMILLALHGISLYWFCSVLCNLMIFLTYIKYINITYLYLLNKISQKNFIAYCRRDPVIQLSCVSYRWVSFFKNWLSQDRIIFSCFDSYLTSYSLLRKCIAPRVLRSCIYRS